MAIHIFSVFSVPLRLRVRFRPIAVLQCPKNTVLPVARIVTQAVLMSIYRTRSVNIFTSD
jgi:hypothetical protein